MKNEQSSDHLNMDPIEWSGPWEAVKEGAPLEEELHRELNPEHPLYRRKIQAVGRRTDQDDVAFRILDDWPRIAVVHLTWRGAAEPDPRWPSTVFCANAAEFMNVHLKDDS